MNENTTYRYTYQSNESNNAEKKYNELDCYLQNKVVNKSPIVNRYIAAVVFFILGLLLFKVSTYCEVISGRAWSLNFSLYDLVAQILLTVSGIICFYLTFIFILMIFDRTTIKGQMTCINNSLMMITKNDGLDAVYEDFTSADKIYGENRIGRRYIFVKGVDIIRIADITGTEISEYENGYYFTVYYNNEYGLYRCFIKRLSSYTEVREMTYKELSNMIEERRIA